MKYRIIIQREDDRSEVGRVEDVELEHTQSGPVIPFAVRQRLRALIVDDTLAMAGDDQDED